MIARCVEIKRDVVSNDECERGLRQTLNLGHTIGHAVESANEYRLGHGSSVAAGMCIMARACAKRGWCDRDVAHRIEAAVAAHGLPTSTDFDVDTLFRHAKADKKRHGDTMNIVAIEAIGSVSIKTLPLDDFRMLIEQGL